jgi:hypothetical protein
MTLQDDILNKMKSNPVEVMAEPKFRDLSEMFEKGRFGVPESKEKLFERVPVNLQYYCVNYALFAALLLVYVCISQPVFLFAVVVAVAGAYFCYLQRDQAFTKIGETRVSQQHLQLITGGVSVLLLSLTGGPSFLSAIALSLLGVGGHAALRMRSVKSKLSSALHRK